MELRLYRYLFWLGYFAILLTVLMPLNGNLNDISIGPESFHIRLDFLLHFSVFFMISMYYLFGHKKGLMLFKENSGLKFMALIVFLGIITEFIQLWVPGRVFNLFDLFANLAGFLFGMTLFYFILRRELS